jgi:hypothetical protein
MRHSIRTLQVPTASGTGAFVVVPARSSTASFNGGNVVEGMPGTVPVPSPRPAALNDGQLGGPFNQPSSVAPDFILPSIYISRVAPGNKHLSGGLYSENYSPKPAAAWSMIPAQWQKRVRVGGRTVTSAVRAFTQWPTYGKNGNV